MRVVISSMLSAFFVTAMVKKIGVFGITMWVSEGVAM